MKDKKEVWQGTLSIMVLKTLDAMGAQHGYGIARRIEQICEDRLAVNHGTLYPVLLPCHTPPYDTIRQGTETLSGVFAFVPLGFNNRSLTVKPGRNSERGRRGDGERQLLPGARSGAHGWTRHHG